MVLTELCLETPENQAAERGPPDLLPAGGEEVVLVGAGLRTELVEPVIDGIATGLDRKEATEHHAEMCTDGGLVDPPGAPEAEDIHEPGAPRARRAQKPDQPPLRLVEHGAHYERRPRTPDPTGASLPDLDCLVNARPMSSRRAPRGGFSSVKSASSGLRTPGESSVGPQGVRRFLSAAPL